MATLRLLNLAQVRPADIILSRSKKIESGIIAWLGQSRFSHAEIIVGDYDGADVTLSACEATTDKSSTKAIVGLVRRRLIADYQFSLRRPASVSLPVLAMDISKYSHFALLRHRQAETEEFDAFRRKLLSLCRPLHLTPYASVKDIAQLTARPDAAEFFGKLSRQIPRHVAPGLFCSQLVSLLYQQGGFPLGVLRPEQMAPRHLQALAAQPDAALTVVPPSDILFDPGTAYEMTQDWRERNTWIDQHSTDVAGTIRISETLTHNAMESIERGLRQLQGRSD
jgi:hypothetical protein